MKASIRDTNGVRVIELKGKITIGAGDVQLRELIKKALEEGKKNIVLDLSGVTLVDSSGIGEMVACFTRVKKKGGKMALAKISPKINDLLQVTQLITVFDVFESQEEAIRELGG